ncbi:MAG: MFS transporter [Chthoniobacterales bacterium]|nr:MFS transporter [Chthoniobacterales bacterium]
MADRDSSATDAAYEHPRSNRPASADPGCARRPEEHDPYAAFRYPAFLFYSLGNCISIAGRQMLTVAIEWEIYARTHSATALGLVGLVIAVPVVVLSLPAGDFADRFSRKRIIMLTQGLSAICSVGLAFVSWKHLALPAWPILTGTNRALAATAHVFERHSTYHFDDLALPLMYSLLFVSACARTFGWAARAAFFPKLVPREKFSNAVTWNSSIFQISCVVGPAVGGLLIVRTGFPFIYVLDAIAACCFLFLVVPIKIGDQGGRVEGNPWRSLVAGLRFVMGKEIILATLTLDLFAVLLGGAVALLPIFADQILHCGPVGLGWLRAAPAIGAFAMAVLIAYLPPMRQAGKMLLWCVAGFGAATIGFGLSTIFWFSLTMLFLTGAFDSVSMVVRHTLVQLLTPDAMRGRVSAVNNVFIGTSNEFGALESGLTAAAFGPVASVVGGGFGTILVVAAVALIWPRTRRIGRLDKGLT